MNMRRSGVYRDLMDTIDRKAAAVCHLQEQLKQRDARIAELTSAFEQAIAQRDVAVAASTAAISKAQWQARTNRELNESAARIVELEREVARLVEAMGAAATGYAHG